MRRRQKQLFKNRSRRNIYENEERLHIVSYRFTFFHNPKLLSSEYFQRTMAIMQKMVDYIASIKPEERDDSEH